MYARGQVAKQIVGAFRGVGTHGSPYKSALVLTDALAGHGHAGPPHR